MFAAIRVYLNVINLSPAQSLDWPQIQLQYLIWIQVGA